MKHMLMAWPVPEARPARLRDSNSQPFDSSIFWSRTHYHCAKAPCRSPNCDVEKIVTTKHRGSVGRSWVSRLAWSSARIFSQFAPIKIISHRNLSFLCHCTLSRCVCRRQGPEPLARSPRPGPVCWSRRRSPVAIINVEHSR